MIIYRVSINSHLRDGDEDEYMYCVIYYNKVTRITILAEVSLSGFDIILIQHKRVEWIVQ